MPEKSNCACDEAVLEKAKLIRDRLVEAVKLKKEGWNYKVSRRNVHLATFQGLIAATGMGGLVADNTIWRIVDEQLEAKALKLDKTLAEGVQVTDL